MKILNDETGSCVPRTLSKKDWLLLMFLFESFMTSIYSIISIETRLVTHFSGYKTITLHEKAMLYVLNHDFRSFTYWNITKFCRSIYFPLVTRRVTRGGRGGGGLPCPFSKIGKKCPDLWKKCPDCSHLWVKFFI